ncbi:MAG: hypothetical protein NZ660_01050 [Oscillatoriaceae bacterium SKYG93]|nr:hypothetical protein [Oscillatoriaceae bacterium SKYG93]MDW8452026.1 hypothetical protein [Oscillatoriaceae cyanobacterium SKYGB_i_bin93]
MVEYPQSPEELAVALSGISELNFQLPEPFDDEISDYEFEQQVDNAWKICDRFDLQTDIWRGRILRAIREREKRGGEGRGTGFLNWLKEREISKSQAYSLIELANSADTLLAEGRLSVDSINNFSKRAFIETAKSSPEIQQLVGEAAKKGERITRREVRQISDEWIAMTSQLLPEELKEKAVSGSIPPRYLAPLAREMEKLPESHIKAIQQQAAENPEVDTVKHLTADARNLSRYLDAAAQVQTLHKTSVDVEMALEEALRVGCLNITAELIKQAAVLENTIAKLYATWKRVASLSDRLYVDTGASTPNLRLLLTCLDRLAGEVIELDLGNGSERIIRLRFLTDNDSNS